MKKNQRKSQAEETVAVCEAGSYRSVSGTIVSIATALNLARRGTVCHGLVSMPSPPPSAFAEPATIEITPETTFAALARLDAEGVTGLGCLNFASAKNPGGGFLNGAEAQEEALSRASGLVSCLMTQFDAFYRRNRGNASCLYLDLAIVAPGVPFFRDDDGTLLDKPVLATVITSPAPNAGVVAQNEPERVPEIVPVLRRRAEQVLRAAALAGVTDLVLGAWGCGVFRNDPANVAEAFARLLGPEGPYHRSFRRVVFAVAERSPERSKLNAFEEVFAEPAAIL